MRSLIAIASLTAFTLATPARAQQPATRNCTAGREPRSEYLDSLVREYHPEVLAPETRRDSTVVAFVLDSACQVVRHAARRVQQSDGQTTDSMLAALFPDLPAGPASFSSAGAAMTAPFAAPGHPLVVWGVLRRS